MSSLVVEALEVVDIFLHYVPEYCTADTAQVRFEGPLFRSTLRLCVLHVITRVEGMRVLPVVVVVAMIVVGLLRTMLCRIS